MNHTTNSQAHAPLAAATPSDAAGRELSIGAYLIKRLQDYGLRHVFGVPGDYVLGFYGLLEQSALEVVGCTREDCAGFAADAYARVHGLGAVCVTYCVGGLSVSNAIAGAYAEKSPVVVISGAPGLSERVNNPLLHHKVRDFRTQLEVFEKLCAAVTELTDPMLACREIDRVLDVAFRYKRPVYIELPRDLVDVVPQGSCYQAVETTCDPLSTDEAVDEARAMLSAAQRPVVIAGVEIHRFGLQDQLVQFAETTRIPVAATVLGKSVMAEQHPLYIGIYEGAMGRQEVTEYVEDSDCVLLLGAFMTDINLGIYTAKLDPARCIYATSEQLRIRHHHYHQVSFREFLARLTTQPPRPVHRAIPAALCPHDVRFELRPEERITVTRLFARLNEQLASDSIVIADIGDSLFGASEMRLRGRTDFISPAYYTSMGFSVPAALGAQIARPEHRIVVVCGDGAFQMTGMELSTIVRRGFSPIVIVLDNGGYGTERVLQSGAWKYNDILPWNYAQLPVLFGGGRGYVASTEGEFDAALRRAWHDRSQFSLIQVRLGIDDFSAPLRRLGERLGKRL